MTVAATVIDTPAGGRVHRLELSRPGVRNALDTPTLAALVDALAAAAEDEAATGLLLLGADGHFSAGADLKEGLDRAGAVRRRELFVLAYEQVSAFPIATAAAVEGVAVGGGIELAAACDLVAVGEGARLRFPGAIHGVPVGVARTVGRVGLGTAKDWVLSSRWFDAAEAAATGFAQRHTATGGAEAAATAWLDDVAQRDRDGVRYLKGMFTDLSGLRDRVARENDALRTHAELGRLPGDRDDPRRSSGRGLPGERPPTIRPRR